ncbi:MAG: glycosyltransferase family 4 protein [Lachnoclostridium sp.]|nr:glycosyltransferase family 4 protein [Lachnoclostridium sp.]
MKHNEIFDKVLFVGPALAAKGGISSVLLSYSSFVHPFHFAAVNSVGGKVSKLLALARTIVAIPFARLAGRKIMHIHFCGGNSWRRERKIARWGKLFGFKTIMHSHAGKFDDFVAQEGAENIRHHFSKNDRIVSLSAKWVGIYKQKLGVDDVRYINNIVLPPRIKRDENPRSELRFVFLGELGERKGVLDILEAVKTLPEDKPWRLIIGGNGDVARLEKAIADSGKADRIEFRGWIGPDEKDKLLAETDVMMLPSFDEGLPISVLEGMANGMGIITTDVGSVSDVITDEVNGLIVTPGDTVSIAEAMKRYIEEPSLIKTHSAVSADRIKAFYPEAVKESLAELYADLLD